MRTRPATQRHRTLSDFNPVRRSSFDLYCADMERFPRIDQEEEGRLAQRIRQGDQEAYERLVTANWAFVITIVKRYQHRGVDLEDLVGAGNVGLLRAAKKFDESKGVKFISYAVWWIRQACQEELRKQGGAVVIPINEFSYARKVDHAMNGYLLAGEPHHVALDKAIKDVYRDSKDLPIQPPSTTIEAARQPLSFQTRTRHTDRELSDVLDMNPEAAAEAEHEDRLADLRYRIGKGLQYTTAKQRVVLENYYGLEGYEPMTLEQVGAMLGITREGARRLREAGLQRIKAKTDQLELYL